MNMRLSLLRVAIVMSLLVGCATVPPKPKCNYQEKEVNAYAMEVNGTVYYVMDEEAMNEFVDRFFSMRQCMTDLEIWGIQVEQKLKSRQIPAAD